MDWFIGIIFATVMIYLVAGVLSVLYTGRGRTIPYTRREQMQGVLLWLPMLLGKHPKP
jgi:uncharacterized membrane protein